MALSTVMRTVEPGRTTAPPTGLWAMTAPGSVHALRVDTLGTSPSAASSCVASAVGSPRRSGTVTPVIVHVNVIDGPDVPTASVAVTDTAYVPAVTGVPAMRDPLALSPGGSPVIDSAYGAVPPDGASTSVVAIASATSVLRTGHGGERLPFQQVGQRREGKPDLGARRLRREHAQAALARGRHSGAPQRRLADSRLAGEHQGAAGFEELAHRRELRVAANDVHVPKIFRAPPPFMSVPSERGRA